MKKRIDKIISCLPERVKRSIDDDRRLYELSELRLRANAPCGATYKGKNLYLGSYGGLYERTASPLKLESLELSECVKRLCDGSVYSYYDSIKNGYITKDGFRIGIVGKGILTDGAPDGFCEFTSLNIRFPIFLKDTCDTLLDYIKRESLSGCGGILVISPPGIGKTTYLRSLAYRLSSGFYDGTLYRVARVCIIDERAELYSEEMFAGCIADVISDLPKAYCVSLCTRVMSPEVMVCDEIGSASEADALCDAQSKGVLLAASCHGKSLDDVIKKPYMKRLFDNGVFGTVCSLSVTDGVRKTEIKRLRDIYG